MTDLKQIKQLAEETWEGCDGCDENDKNFWINGFITGYNRAKPDELSDELRYKDGTPIRKHNSPKLQAIEMEISDEEIEKECEKLYQDCNPSIRKVAIKGFKECAKWYRERLKI